MNKAEELKYRSQMAGRILAIFTEYRVPRCCVKPQVYRNIKHDPALIIASQVQYLKCNTM